jgi:hypothetical protein
MTVGHPASQKFKRGELVTHIHKLGSRLLIIRLSTYDRVYVWDGQKKFLCETQYLQKPLDKWY